MIGGRRPISGRKPGDKRVRVERHHAPYFRYTGPGQLTAKAAASAPTTTVGQVRARVKALLLGGEPLDAHRHIWWNFVSSSKERIEQAKDDWREGKFGQVPGETEFIPLPDH